MALDLNTLLALGGQQPQAGGGLGMQLAAADPRILQGPPRVPTGSPTMTAPPVPPPQINIPTPSFGGGGGGDITAPPDERFQNPNPASATPTTGGVSPMSGAFSSGAAGDILGAGTAGAMYAGGTPWDLAGSVGGTIGNFQNATPGVPTGVGGAFQGGGVPPTATGAGDGSAAAPSPQGAGGNKLLDALRGVKAPAPPQAQTVRTPPPPQLAPIKGGEFVQMLASLGVTPQEFIRMRMGGR